MTLQLKNILLLCALFSDGLEFMQGRDMQQIFKYELTWSPLQMHVPLNNNDVSCTIYACKFLPLNNNRGFVLSPFRSILMPVMGKWHRRAMDISWTCCPQGLSLETSILALSCANDELPLTLSKHGSPMQTQWV